MPHDIFLSYSRKDIAVMERTKADLTSAGFAVWTDQGIEPGTPSWTIAIERAITEARCLVGIMSPDAKNSTWVREELRFAQIHDKPIFLVLARGSETESIPFGFASHQWIDLRDKNKANSEFIRLLETLKRQIATHRSQSSFSRNDSQTLIASSPKPTQGIGSEAPSQDQIYQSKLITLGYKAIMTIEEVFSLTARGTVVTGTISFGAFRIGDPVEVFQPPNFEMSVLSSKIQSIETFSKSLQKASTGENTGFTLHGVNRNEVQKGMIVTRRD